MNDHYYTKSNNKERHWQEKGKYYYYYIGYSEVIKSIIKKITISQT
jgi:hypothetical protein